LIGQALPSRAVEVLHTSDLEEERLSAKQYLVVHVAREFAAGD